MLLRQPTGTIAADMGKSHFLDRTTNPPSLPSLRADFGGGVSPKWHRRLRICEMNVAAVAVAAVTVPLRKQTSETYPL